MPDINEMPAIDAGAEAGPTEAETAQAQTPSAAAKFVADYAYGKLRRETIEMAHHAASKIEYLQERITTLQPKADAYETLTIALHLMQPRGGEIMGENLAARLRRRAEELEEEHKSR